MKPVTYPLFPLHVDEFLGNQPSDVLKIQARLWGGKSNLTKAECIDMIRKGLADPAAARTALTGLTPVDQAALAIIKGSNGVMPAGQLEVMLRAFGFTLDEPQHTYTNQRSFVYAEKLVRRGYVMVKGGLSSGYHIGLTEDTLLFCDERIMAQMEAVVMLHPLPLPPVEPLHTSIFRRPQNVTLDLVSLIQKIREMNGLQLTKAGDIRLPDLRQLRKKMDWPEDVVTDGFCFPNSVFALLTSFQKIGLLEQVDNKLVLHQEIDGFLAQPLAHQVTVLVTGLFSNTVCFESSEHYYYRNHCLLRVGLVHALMALPDITKFYTLPGLQTVLYDRVGEWADSTFHASKPLNYYGNRGRHEEELAKWKQQHRQSWLAVEGPIISTMLTSWLYWLGMVELGRSSDETLRFRLTELGRQVLWGDYNANTQTTKQTTAAGAVWVVQPNFDIIVYLEAVTPAQLSFLEQHAERTQTEQHTAHYVLTRASVYRGLESGGTLENILATLAVGSDATLPQNVEREIREWAGQREQITLYSRGRLIEFPSRETRELAMDAGLQGERISEVYVRVQPQTQIKAALKSVFGLQVLPSFDYAQPPDQCLHAAEDGTLTLVKQTGDMLLSGQLACCTEPVDATHWQITVESLAAAKKAGGKAKTVLAFLESRLEKPLPELLEIAIRTNLGEKKAVQAQEALLLRITDKKLYGALIGSKSLKQFLLDVPGPDTIAIRREQLAEFNTHLSRLGIILEAYTPVENRPDWQQTVRDAKSTERRRGWW